MIPPKPETILIRTAPTAPSQAAEGQTNPHASLQQSTPVLSNRANTPRSQAPAPATYTVLASTEPSLVERQPADAPSRTLIFDGVWIRNAPRVLRLLARLNLQDLPTGHDADRWNEGKRLAKAPELENGAAFLLYLDYLEFDSDQHKFQFLIQIANNAPQACGKYFERFNLSDQEQIFQLAMACANDPDFLAHVKEIRLDSEAHRVDLAMRCLSVCRKEIFGKHMKEFNIADPATHLEIAQQLAHEAPSSLCKNLDNFYLPAENDRINLATICAECDETNLPKQFEKFRISDEKVRIQLATRCAEKDGINLARHIGKFSIRDENARFIMAKKCLDHMIDHDPDHLDLIHNFHILDKQKNKVFIDKIRRNIYSDEDWKNLFNFIKKSPAQTNPIGTLIDAYLSYKGNDQELQYEDGATRLIMKALRKEARMEGDKAIKPPYFMFLFSLHDIELMETLHKNSDVVVNIIGMPLQKMIRQDADDDEKMEIYHWVRDLIFYVGMRGIESETLDGVLKPIFEKIQKFKDIKYRNFLTNHIFSAEQNFPSKSDLDGFSNDARIPALLMMPFSNPVLTAFLIASGAGIMKDGFHQRQFIERVCALKNASIPANAVREILRKIFSDNSLMIKDPADDASANPRTRPPVKAERLEKFNQVLQVFSKLRTIIDFNEEEKLNQVSNFDEMNAIIKNIAKENFSLSDERYLKFSEKFFSYRDDMSLLTYLSRIRHLQIAPTLTRFVNLVLDEAFLTERYQRSEVLNLCEPELQAAWMRNAAANGANFQRFMFTDEHQDLIRMGSDVRGSCQRIDGDPALNRGLLGAVMDGSEKICVLKDKSGKILQRCILRLMWATPPGITDRLDPRGSPCLFMEKIYPPNLNIQSKAALIDFAAGQAQRLGLALAMIDDDDDALKPLLSNRYQLTPTTSVLYSGAIQHPLYSDALNGIQDRGFSLTPARWRQLNWLSHVSTQTNEASAGSF